MDRLTERLQIAKKALDSLTEALEFKGDDSISKLLRDASIQRFEYTLESTWKLAQLYLRSHEGIEHASPKSVIRSCFQVKLLDESQTNLALTMMTDRNLTVHTYNEDLANQIYAKIPQYKSLLALLIENISKKTTPTN